MDGQDEEERMGDEWDGGKMAGYAMGNAVGKPTG
jgi:hypothetical protein